MANIDVDVKSVTGAFRRQTHALEQAFTLARPPAAAAATAPTSPPPPPLQRNVRHSRDANFVFHMSKVNGSLDKNRVGWKASFTIAQFS